MKLKEFYSQNFSPKLTIFSIILAVLMLTASRWQWTRYYEKLDIEQKLETLKKSTVDNYSDAIEITDFLNQDISTFANQVVKIKGSFDFSHQELILNQRTKSGPGAWILTKFNISNNYSNSIYVSRGLVPIALANSRGLNSFNHQEEFVFGILKPTIPKRSMLSPSAQTNVKNEWLYADIELISEKNLDPVNSEKLIKKYFLQRVGRPVSGDYPEQDISIQVPSSTHFWYTFEWIVLALFTLIISFVIQIFRPRKRIINKISNSVIAILFAIITVFFSIKTAHAITDIPSVEQKAGIIQRLGEKIDTNLVFTDETGSSKPIRDFIIPNKPLIIAPVYFECPRLCTLTQEGLVNSLERLDLKLGIDFNVLSVSINPRETSTLANKKAEKYRTLYKDLKLIKNQSSQYKSDGWKFLVGDQNSINLLMDKLGFKYEIDKGEFLHAAGIIVLTPDGTISRYLLGIDYPKRDFTLALVEASQGKIGSLIDQVLMFCFRYDHIKGQYTFAIWAIIRIVSIGFAVVLLTTLILLKRKENLG